MYLGFSSHDKRWDACLCQLFDAMGLQWAHAAIDGLDLDVQGLPFLVRHKVGNAVLVRLNELHHEPTIISHALDDFRLRLRFREWLCNTLRH